VLNLHLWRDRAVPAFARPPPYFVPYVGDCNTWRVPPAFFDPFQHFVVKPRGSCAPSALWILFPKARAELHLLTGSPSPSPWQCPGVKVEFSVLNILVLLSPSPNTVSRAEDGEPVSDIAIGRWLRFFDCTRESKVHCSPSGP